MTGYTPLMLAIAGGNQNLDCVKELLNYNADFSAKDLFGNSILHIAAIHSNNALIGYIAKNLKIDIFGRNNKGETALNICMTTKNSEGQKILQEFSEEYDQTKNLAKDLLNELEDEEEKQKENAAKNKQKKWRNKVNKLSKQLGISVEEVEKKLAKEAEEKKEAEMADERRIAERQRQEEIAEQKRKEELRRQAEEERKRLAIEEELERQRLVQ